MAVTILHGAQHRLHSSAILLRTRRASIGSGSARTAPGGISSDLYVDYSRSIAIVSCS